MSKVCGDENVADVGTKPLGPTAFAKYREQLGIGHVQFDASAKEVNALSGSLRRAVATLGISPRVMALAIALSQC